MIMEKAIKGKGRKRGNSRKKQYQQQTLKVDYFIRENIKNVLRMKHRQYAIKTTLFLIQQ